MSRTPRRDENRNLIYQAALAGVLALPLVLGGCAGNPSTSVPGIPGPPTASIPSPIPSPSGSSSPSGDKSSRDSGGKSSDNSKGSEKSGDGESGSSGGSEVGGPELPSAGGGIPWPAEDGGSSGGDIAHKKDKSRGGESEFPGDEFPADSEAGGEEGQSGSEDGDLKSKGGGGEEEVAEADADSGGRSQGTPGGTGDDGFISDIDLTLEDVPLLEDGVREVLEDPEGELAEAVLEEILEKANLPSIPGLPTDTDTGMPIPIPHKDGPLTPAEQVAVLDAELDRSAGDFDDMILDEQNRQREQPPATGRLPQAQAEEDNEEAAQGSGSSTIGGNMPRGRRSVDVARADMPESTAKFPPPADIPSGNDDDVVARQLREAAMREPDPELREKLWDEYRKYKGIGK